MKRAIALGVLLTGICTTHASAQAGQRLLSSFRTGWTLDCTIAGPTVARLQRADLLRSLEQGVEAIRGRHDMGDDGTPPSFRVANGRPRIEPGGRRTLQQGMLIIDYIWDNGGSGDRADEVVRDAGRFLEAGIVDDDDDESIAVLERAVLTQAFAYAVHSRIAGLCGTTLGAAAPVVAGGSARSSGSGQGIAGGTRTLGRGSEAQVGQRFQPVVEGRRRSVGRTTGGVALLGTGVLFLLNGYLEAEDQRGVAEILAAGLPTLSASADRLWRSGDQRGYQRVQAQYLATSGDAEEYEKSADQEFMMGLLIGVPLMTLGTLLATRWAHVGSDTVAFNVSPTGFRASKSFGW